MKSLKKHKFNSLQALLWGFLTGSSHEHAGEVGVVETDDEYVIYYPGNGWTGDSGWTPNEDEQESFEAVRDESRDESRNILRIHLFSYRDQTIGHGARPTFRGWVQSIHPENVRQGIIDPRLLLPESEHLQIWNEVFPNRQVVGVTLVTLKK